MVLLNVLNWHENVVVDELTLVFFDTLMAHLNALHMLRPQTSRLGSFDHFEYYDEDGEAICVRCDDELAVLLSFARDHSGPLEIRLTIIESNGRGEGVDGTPQPLERHGETPLCLEDLHLLQMLSEGQFGSVYKALDALHDRIMVVKAISIDESMGTRTALMVEVETLRTASDHPCIVAFYGAIFSESALYLCMELMDGLDIARYGKLPMPVLGAVAVAVVDALLHLWSKSIMHRDVKPSNFLVSRNGSVKLGDMGASKQLLQQSVAWSYVGTRGYMAPERLNGQLYRTHSDIWALGASMIELALGRPPSYGSGTGALIPSFSKPSLVAEIDVGELRELGIQCSSLLDFAANWSQADAALSTMCRPEERVKPEHIRGSQFIASHSPMDTRVVAEFISSWKGA